MQDKAQTPDAGTLDAAQVVSSLRKWADDYEPHSEIGILLSSSADAIAALLQQLSEAKLATDILEQLRLWIWEQFDKHGKDLRTAGRTFDLILNKIDELRDKLATIAKPVAWLYDFTDPLTGADYERIAEIIARSKADTRRDDLHAELDRVPLRDDDNDKDQRNG